jgi:hypothetical protein
VKRRMRIERWSHQFGHSKFADPIVDIHILEQLPVNRPQVRQS